jgi:predicted nucleotidyltransferase
LDLYNRVSAILADDLVGFYLYGSLATGGFQVGRSDIDFVVITRDQLPTLIIASLEAIHEELIESGDKWANKLEGAYVPQVLGTQTVS